MVCHWSVAFDESVTTLRYPRDWSSHVYLGGDHTHHGDMPQRTYNRKAPVKLLTGAFLMAYLNEPHRTQLLRKPASHGAGASIHDSPAGPPSPGLRSLIPLSRAVKVNTPVRIFRLDGQVVEDLYYISNRLTGLPPELLTT